MDLHAFRRDLAAYFRSAWPLSQKLKAPALLLRHRWHRYWKSASKKESTLTIREPQRFLTLSMRMDTDDFFAFQEVFVYRYYDAPVGEPATILDLGANCGFATLLFATRFPGARIAAVEPHPANVLALRRNLELNRVLATIIPGAAASEDGPCQLVVSTSLNHTLMSPGYEGDSRTITVDGWSVPTLMTRLGWDRIDLLKIDIEGYERTLFADRPVWLTRVNRIIGEVHSGYGLESLIRDLAPFGFTVTALDHPRMFLADRSRVR
ncbi:MAG TPA: FkbM family methyltransferase [Vicinamibacterales bacterium]|nr:FkbM family methyltransferase [Vicinamibacterales bacterium]